jgi:hypothetical protein
MPAHARPPLQPPNVSCQGNACDGGNSIRDYVYELHEVEATADNLRQFSVGVLDPGGITNILGPEGWTAEIKAADTFIPRTDNVFTEHGLVAPEPWQDVPYVITWTAPGNGIPPSEWTTLLFGFDDPMPPVNVTWGTNFSSANTSNVVAGGAGVYTYGPVHTPVPEPSTVVLLLAGAMGLVAWALRWR